jgi:hypothetical protein
LSPDEILAATAGVPRSPFMMARKGTVVKRVVEHERGQAEVQVVQRFPPFVGGRVTGLGEAPAGSHGDRHRRRRQASAKAIREGG